MAKAKAKTKAILTSRRLTKKRKGKKDLWVVGVDPGFGMTGLVLMHGKTVAAFASYTSPPSDDVIGRVTSMSNSIVTQILKWIWQFELTDVSISIETPIYNSNAGTLMLQMRLFQDIESGLYHLIAPELTVCNVYEVNPTTSKTLATGNGRASKGEIITASPLLSIWAENPAPQEVMEAIADAWAHSLAVYSDDIEGVDMVNLAYVQCTQTSDAVLIDAPNEDVTGDWEEEEDGK